MPARHAAHVAIDESHFVTSSRTGFLGRAMTQAKLYSAIGKVTRVVPSPPGPGSRCQRLVRTDTRAILA